MGLSHRSDAKEVTAGGWAVFHLYSEWKKTVRQCFDLMYVLMVFLGYKHEEHSGCFSDNSGEKLSLGSLETTLRWELHAEHYQGAPWGDSSVRI
jgi:hypothetical protein